MTRKIKPFLLQILASAVWPSYNSGRMESEWTKETADFMFEQDQTTSKGRTPGFDLTNSLKYFALWILILEIELGIDIQDYRKPEDSDPDGNPTVNADHIAADEVFNTTK
ncbi:hypothetical protein BO71DRAFT_435928 [Aspergillus ellipticus CBS 707.79]|uniref:Uncharacterized protein n=1 Tax=Aspergillus ellipticus CBS 707.79 TaxID=1448320 RepID=A0A319CSF4_9EURO|nr:hypothetical protein BO71DRAFT_435928 [Aspergillus ellipticus CBS 707.79]